MVLLLKLPLLPAAALVYPLMEALQDLLPNLPKVLALQGKPLIWSHLITPSIYIT